MTDYTQIILAKFASFSGIVNYPDRIVAMNAMMNDLEAAGFGKLVQGIVTRPTDQARDFLFEAWIAQILRRNPDVRDLDYEPEDMADTAPDFRFYMGPVRFNVQVKRLYAVGNAPDKNHFRMRFETESARVKKPWFLNLWLSDTFAKIDADPLFYSIKKGVEANKFTPEPGADLPTFEYSWPQLSTADAVKARFSFHVASDPTAVPHLHLGTILIGGAFQYRP